MYLILDKHALNILYFKTLIRLSSKCKNQFSFRRWFKVTISYAIYTIYTKWIWTLNNLFTLQSFYMLNNVLYKIWNTWNLILLLIHYMVISFFIYIWKHKVMDDMLILNMKDRSLRNVILQENKKNHLFFLNHCIQTFPEFTE